MWREAIRTQHALADAPKTGQRSTYAAIEGELATQGRLAIAAARLRPLPMRWPQACA